MIYLVGGSGGPNFGDELIMLHWLRKYRAAGFHEEIVVDCKSVANSLKLHGAPFTEHRLASRAEGALAWPPDRAVRFVHLMKAASRGKHGTLSDHALLGREFVRRNLGRFAGREPGGLDLGDCDVIHLIGGGYINGVWPSSGALLGAAAELSRIFRVPLVATGLGLEPLEKFGNRDHMARILASFSLFECRDEGSLDALARAVPSLACVQLGVDDSFLEEVAADSTKGPKTLHISSYDKHAEHFVGPRAARGLEECARAFDKVVFWQATPADGSLVAPLRKVLGEVDVYRTERLLYGGPLMRSGDFLITSRFHPHLLAARMGMAGAYFANSKFYRSKHAGACRLGSAFQCFQSTREIDPGGARSSAAACREKDYVAVKSAVANRVMTLAGGLESEPSHPQPGWADLDNLRAGSAPSG